MKHDLLLAKIYTSVTIVAVVSFSIGLLIGLAL